MSLEGFLTMSTNELKRLSVIKKVRLFCASVGGGEGMDRFFL